MEPTKVTINFDETGIDISLQATVDGLEYTYAVHLDQDSTITTEELTERHPQHAQVWEVSIDDEEMPTLLTLYDTSDSHEVAIGMWNEAFNGQYVEADLDTDGQPYRQGIEAFQERFPHVRLLDHQAREDITEPFRELARRYSHNLADTRAADQAASNLPAVKIYTKPNCVQCQATQRRLDAAGVPYTVTDISNDPQMIEELRTAGYTSMPIVEYGQERFAGYQVDRIKALTQAFGAVNNTPGASSESPKTTPPSPRKTESRGR